MFFFQLTLSSNNLVLTSYSSGIYLESWFSWLSRLTLKSEEEEKRRIHRKSNNNNTHLWFKIIFCSKTWFEKKLFIPLYRQILFTVFMRCRIFET